MKHITTFTGAVLSLFWLLPTAARAQEKARYTVSNQSVTGTVFYIVPKTSSGDLGGQLLYPGRICDQPGGDKNDIRRNYIYFKCWDLEGLYVGKADFNPTTQTYLRSSANAKLFPMKTINGVLDCPLNGNWNFDVGWEARDERIVRSLRGWDAACDAALPLRDPMKTYVTDICQ